MAETTIDTLQIEISASASSAEKSLDKLANSLLKLRSNISGISWKNLSNFSNTLNKLSGTADRLNAGRLIQYSTALNVLSQSVTGLKSVKNNIDDAAKALEQISGLDTSKLQIAGDFSGLNSLGQGLGSLADSMSKLAGIEPDNINKTVKIVRKLQGLDLSGLGAGLQSVSGADLSSLSNLGTAFQSFTSSMAGADKVAVGTAKIFNSLAQLSASAGNLSTVQQYLPVLSAEIGRFVSAMSQAPAVQAGTVSLVTALSGIAGSGSRISKAAAGLPALSAGVREFISSLSGLHKVNNNTLRAVEGLSRLAPAGAKAGSAARSLQKNITGLSTSLNGLASGSAKAAGGLKTFAGQALSIFGVAGGIYAIVSAIKNAITYSSDLSEAQNVVNQGFGDLSYMADDFAKTALYSFGLSELQAKRTSGQFAAMARALGVVPEQAAQMSLALTGLTGDLSSFWNVSQDVSQTALESVFTGETESLKKFGVVMTEANLQQYAYSQGIIKSISAMTGAEKAQLRYLFVTEAASVAQGDFAKTAGSFANQVRLLTGQLQTLAGIVGGVLVAAFTPVLRVINTVLSVIITLANTLSSFVGGLFGFESQAASAGAGLADMAQSAGGVASGMEDAAGGIGDVGSAAKKSEKKLNGFIAGWHEVNNMTSNDDSGGSGGGAAGGGLSLPTTALPTDYTIDIDAEDKTSPVIDRIRNRFIELKDLFLAGFKLGLGDTAVFDSIYQNLQGIGESLRGIFSDSEVITAFNTLLDALSYNFGAKLGSFISIGGSIVDNITGGIEISLQDNKERIQDWLVGMFDITGRIDTIITNFQVALAQIFTVFQSDEAKQITASIITIFSSGFMGITTLAGNLGADILGLILNPITENAEGFREALQSTMGPVSEVLTTLSDSFTALWTDINQVYEEHISPMFVSFTDGISEIVGALLDGYNTHIVPVLDKLADKFSKVWSGTISPLLSNFIGLFGDVADLVKSVWENIFQPLVLWVAGNIMPVVSPVLESLGTLVLNVFDNIGSILDTFVTTARGVIQFLTDIFSGDWSEAWESVKDTFKTIWDEMPDFIKTPIRTIIGIVNKMIAGIESGINSVITGLNKLSFDVPDWVPGLGGESFGFSLSEVSLPRVPELARGGIISRATIAMIGEDGAEAVIPLERNTGWMSRIAGNIVDEMGNIRLNIMPDTTQFQYKKMRVDTFAQTQKIQESIGQFMEEVKRQNGLLEDVVTAIENKQLQIGDDQIFNSTRRAQQRFWRRTHRTGIVGID